MSLTKTKAPPHLDWLVDTGRKLKTACGADVDVLELRHVNDTGILSAWAVHFRNQYCSDDIIDALKGKMSRKDYLENIKFPSKTNAPGPSIRAGDFAEILLADYLEWRLGFWVPRLRWSMKYPNESVKGCDVIGFHFAKNNGTSPKDMLAIIESKANLSATKKNRLQDAVVDSVKDDRRKGESLNALKQRLIEQGKSIEAGLVGRFQDPVDVSYQDLRAAAAVFSTSGYDEKLIQETDATSIEIKVGKNGKKTIKHPHHGNLSMVVVKGDDLMALVNDLYQRAADEA
ncbi:MAG: SAVED domain-containing protein [Alphaproteobacteria bacterium]|jgi:hypothetical protein|nr:SAVED domain-containing protein [Alphaproteobacteria bacterium]